MMNGMKQGLAGLLALAAFAAASAQATDRKPDITLKIMDCGHVGVKDLEIFSDGGEYKGQSRELVVSCYLITHPGGTLMWDTGLSDSLAGQPVEGDFNLWINEPVREQLTRAGIQPEEVDFIAFSHMHFDHTGNASAFRNATWLSQRAEYNAAFTEGEKIFGFDPATYESLLANKTIQFTGDYDVFGDGSVKILSAPGHTPGHQVLYLDLKESGPVILSGDLYHLEESRTHRRVPSFNTDRHQTLASMSHVEDLIEKTKARLITQHNWAEFQTLPTVMK